MAQAVCVDPTHVEKVWPLVSHFILSAMKRGDGGSFAEVQDGVLTGRALLWLAVSKEIEGAAVTKIAITESGKVCWIVACGGVHLSRWIDCLDAIEAYAKTVGCHAVRLMGRSGWLRVLKNYKATKIVLERRL